MRVRPPPVAGRFYPADPGELRDLVDRLLDEVCGQPRPVPPAAVVAPHAGSQYSGAVAATAYAHLTVAPQPPMARARVSPRRRAVGAS